MSRLVEEDIWDIEESIASYDAHFKSQVGRSMGEVA